LEPSVIPKIQETISKIDSSDARKITQAVLSSGKVTEISKLLK